MNKLTKSWKKHVWEPLKEWFRSLFSGGGAPSWKACSKASRKYYSGKVGVHATSGKYSFAAAAADIVFAQCAPGKSAAQIKGEVSRAKGTGKPVNFFELSRHEARDLAKAALDSGAFGVGNW